MTIKSTQSNSAPVLNYSSLDAPVILHQGRIIRLGELLHTVDYLSEQMPAHQYVLNLYEDRYYFLLGFLLALKHKTISLFPSTINTNTLAQLKETYHDVLVLTDNHKNSEALYCETFKAFDLSALLPESIPAQSQTIAFPEISLQQIVAIIFTSGSTGQPIPYKKLWSDLYTTSGLLAEKFLSADDSQEQHSALLATVPAQHMYGLEASIMMALQHGLLMHSKKPFFPQDISDCVADFKDYAQHSDSSINIVLITTPLHLKACIRTAVNLSPVNLFISATAPLDSALALSCEQQYDAQVKEIFGCTEVGSMAFRRTTEAEQWTVLDDITLETKHTADEVLINTTRSIKCFPFNDIVTVIDSKHFLLKGRKEDLINQAGKRTSLAYLNHHLQSYTDLTDACYYQDSSQDNSQDSSQDNSQEAHHKESRLIAFVVLKDDLTQSPQILAQTQQSLAQAQQQKTQQIKNFLKNKIDAVFLPRKIFYVPQLPRNSTGKLPLSALKKLFSHYDTAENR